jgi:hypothetical protein
LVTVPVSSWSSFVPSSVSFTVIVTISSNVYDSFESPYIVPASLVSSVPETYYVVLSSQPSLVVISWSDIPTSVPFSSISSPVTPMSGTFSTLTLSYIPSSIP